MGTPSKTETVIDLVHRLDEAKEHLRKVTAEIEGEIGAILRELAKAMGETNGQVLTALAATKSGPKAAAKELELVMPPPKKQSYSDLALEALKRDPYTSVSELSRLLYQDDDTPSKEKTRAVLYFLANRANKIRKTADGAGWEIIA
jgi:hypothetical protein